MRTLTKLFAAGLCAALLASATLSAQSSYTFTTGTEAFTDISTSGTTLSLSDDGETNTILPFDFTYFGELQLSGSSLRVGNNGAFGFGDSGDYRASNPQLPATSDAYNNLPSLAVWHDDWDDESGGVYTQVNGSAPNRRFIIQWTRDRFGNDNTATASFQVTLEEGTNEIVFIYADTNVGDPRDDAGASGTIGLQKDPQTAVQFSFNEATLSDGLSIRWVPCSGTDCTVAEDGPISIQGSDETFATIQAAIDAAEGGQTIVIPADYDASAEPTIDTRNKSITLLYAAPEE